MDEFKNWMKLAHQLSCIFSKPWGLLLYIYLYSKTFGSLYKFTHLTKQHLSLMYTIHTLMPQVIVLLTLMLAQIILGMKSPPSGLKPLLECNSIDVVVVVVVVVVVCVLGSTPNPHTTHIHVSN
jgi:hypothetical protein